jgi:hypothetical protein
MLIHVKFIFYIILFLMLVNEFIFMVIFLYEIFVLFSMVFMEHVLVIIHQVLEGFILLMNVL